MATENLITVSGNKNPQQMTLISDSFGTRILTEKSECAHAPKVRIERIDSTTAATRKADFEPSGQYLTSLFLRIVPEWTMILPLVPQGV
ncbi:MAG: hypothetical protein JRC60_04070 [Deltaproteobacteria bacterium]|nr:hypothetical protein [Deltaproteobacteria bacterium]